MEPGPTHDPFARAARALSDPRTRPAHDAAALLDRLGYSDGDPDLHRAAMLRAASKLRRVFQLSAPDAPGLIFMGGEADPAVVEGGEGHPVASLAGSGLTLGAAFERCVGEGIEYLSQVGIKHLTVETAVPSVRLAVLDPASRRFAMKDSNEAYSNENTRRHERGRGLRRLAPILRIRGRRGVRLVPAAASM